MTLFSIFMESGFGKLNKMCMYFSDVETINGKKQF